VHPIARTSAAGRPLLAKLEEIALALPEAKKILNHGRPSFAVREKTFVMFMDDHHGDGRIAIWCKAPPGDQADMVESDPKRYFVPPYVGPRGWVGVRLDVPKTSWKTIATIVRESYRMTAPKRLLVASQQT
jgi:hypothetical protein